MKLTDAGLAWLKQLAERPGSQRRTGPVGYRCMTAGWTEWNYVDIKTGEPISENALRLKYGDRWFNKTTPIGERLTDEGRLVLESGVVGKEYV